MKNILSFCAAIIISLLYACNQPAGESKAGDIQAKGLSTEPAGTYMKATINGKEWTASKTFPDYSTNSNYKKVHFETDAYFISFSLYKPTTGNKRSFGEENAADFGADDDYFSAKKGEVTVTKADDKWIEGSFYFTATSSRSNKVYEITNGSFRIETNPKK